MPPLLQHIISAIYEVCDFKTSALEIEQESQEYYACKFSLNGKVIISRNAKITPKKVGQFVTFWKRENKDPIAPFHTNDTFDFFIVNVKSNQLIGQFVFPKATLIKKRMISTNLKEGKRAFRVYPSWDTTNNKQAERTQKWQLDYFYEINDKTDFEKVKKLYQ